MELGYSNSDIQKYSDITVNGNEITVQSGALLSTVAKKLWKIVLLVLSLQVVFQEL